MAEYDFTNIVEELALEHDIQDCKVESQYSTSKGDGYTGAVKAVQLIGSNNKKLDIVFKYVTRNKKAYESIPLRDAYIREIIFYKKIAPAFAKFQDEHNIKDPFDNTAKFYGSVEEPFNELLALGNLKVNNYDLWDRKQLMNNEHLEFAMKVFGKFHGTSIAMQTINSKLFKEITKGISGNDLLKTVFDQMKFAKQLSLDIQDILCTFDPVTEETYHNKFKQFGENIDNEWENIFQFHDLEVILQGDCWCNNAMYQYENMDNRSKPINMKLLDLQICKMGSPVLDVSYFFYTISPTESLDKLNYFLEIYHKALSDHLKQFNLNADEIFPYSKLLQHWEAVSKFGLMLSFMARRAMLQESETAPELSGNMEDFLSEFKVDPKNQQIYRQQLKELVMHFIDRKLI